MRGASRSTCPTARKHLQLGSPIILSAVNPTKYRTQVERFRDEVADRQQTDKIHLLLNNAGISGGGSMFTNSRDEWESTFNICWGGVYHCTRAFLPMLQNAEEGHIVNTSGINGFWASVGPRIPHTAYSAAKFAVGFTEALITDLRINAPHIKCSVVMPGQIGTSIRANTRKIHSGDREADAIDAAGLAQARERFALLGRDVSQLSDDQLRNLVAELERRFRDEALTSAAQAATIILEGVDEFARAAGWSASLSRTPAGFAGAPASSSATRNTPRQVPRHYGRTHGPRPRRAAPTWHRAGAIVGRRSN